MRLRTSSISYKSLVMLPVSRYINTYPVFKTLLTIILLIREEGANPYPSLVEDRDNKGDLDFII